MLIVKATGLPSTTAGLATTSPRKRSANSRASASDVSGNSTRNSSPPLRPMASARRIAPEATSAKCRSTASPTAWPSSSLTRLNSSRSIASTLLWISGRRFTRACSDSMRCRMLRRFGRLVSASVNARCCSSVASARRSVMSSKLA